MGPQLGYYYPEIVQQIDLHGPGINAQGVAVPGLAMYMLIGRTQDYAWSLTSAGHDVRDVFAERLCEPDGSAAEPGVDPLPATGGSATLRELQRRPAGRGPGHATTSPCTAPCSPPPPSAASPTRCRGGARPSGATALNLAALKDMTEGDARTPKRFWKTANQFGFTFNWALRVAQEDGVLHLRPAARARAGLDRRLPTLGTGKYEWQGFLNRGRASARRRAAPAACCSTGTTVGARASCTATTSRTARCIGSSCSTSGRATRCSPTTSGS